MRLKEREYDPSIIFAFLYFAIIVALIIHANYSGEIIRSRIVDNELAIKQCKFELVQDNKRLNKLEDRQYELLDMIKNGKR